MAPTCGPIPSVRLTKIFRQAQQSTVVTNTHWINQGLPSLTDGLRDFFLFVEDDTDNAAGLNVDVVARRIPRKFRLDPRRDVQVLAPMHRGPAALPSSPPSASWPRAHATRSERASPGCQAGVSEALHQRGLAAALFAQVVQASGEPLGGARPVVDLVEILREGEGGAVGAGLLLPDQVGDVLPGLLGVLGQVVQVVQVALAGELFGSAGLGAGLIPLPGVLAAHLVGGVEELCS